MTHVSFIPPTVPKGTLGNGEGSAPLSPYQVLISHGSHTHDCHPLPNILTAIYPLNNVYSLLIVLLRVHRF